MPKQLRSADELVKLILSDPKTWESVQPEHRMEFTAQLWDLAKKAGDEVPANPLESDAFIYRMVVGVIGVVAIIALIGAILASTRPSPAGDATALLTAMVSISSASIGALAGLLAPVSARR